MIDIEKIKQLAQIMEDTALSAVEVREGKSIIRLEKNIGSSVAVPVLPAVEKQAQVIQTTQAICAEDKNTFVIKSPMVGVFYAAPSPDSEPFVAVGQSVKKGDPVCIIEAMKLMNDLCAEVDGSIAKIHVENGQLVEFGQPIFTLTV